MSARKAQEVATDTSVLINFAVVDRLALLGGLTGLRFVAPDAVIGEIKRPDPRKRIETAVDAGHLGTVVVDDVPTLARFARLRREMGPGEAACLALALQRHWWLACDDRHAVRRAARELLGEGRLLNTAGLFLLAIREGLWSVRDADRAKETLANNRFHMKFRSFEDLV